MPDASPFIIRPQDMPSASVILDLNTDLTSRQVEAIAYHVSKSIQNLNLDNVSIIDTNGRSLFQVGPDGIAGSMNAQSEMEFNKRTELENQVRAMLSPQYNAVEVAANLRWDWTGGHTESVTYRPPIEGAAAGVPDHLITHESSVSNTEAAMEPGVQANNETLQYPASTGGGSEATSLSQDITHLYDTTREYINHPATGRIVPADSSFAIRVFLNRTYTEDAARAAGDLDNITWEDYQTNLMSPLVPIEISEQTIDLIRAATGIQNVVIEGYELPITLHAEQVVRPVNQWLMAGLLLLLIGLLAFGLIRRTQPDAITEIEPELSVEELLVSSNAQEEAEEALPEIDYFADSELKKQIDKFVDEKPEAAAQLLRNWLSEDWD
jgi:flagellar M-ring protein FliF